MVEELEKNRKLIDRNIEEKSNLLFELSHEVREPLKKINEISYNYKNGGVCGIDKECKFAQSSRIFSQNGYAPTLTANNTADNCKIVVEGD